MNEQLYLQKPIFDLQKEYLEFYHEWKESNEPFVPWIISNDPTDFKAFLAWLRNHENPRENPKGWVPSTTYLLVNEQKRILGVVNIRHSLNDELYLKGGHIGYGIRPSERRKGYATRLLTLALNKAKELKIERVLVTCDKKNIASRNVILKNGGIQDKHYIENTGNVVLRFWIENK